jgi:hypothetical protein
VTHKPSAKIVWHCAKANTLRLFAHRWRVLVVLVGVDVVLVLVDVEVLVDVDVVVVSQPVHVL